METKNILLIAAIGLGAYAFTQMQTKEPRFMVPGVGYVPVSLLPSYGYVQMPNGQWYAQSQVDAATVAAGGTPGTSYSSGMQIFNDIMGILNTVAPLVTNVITLVTNANRTASINQILSKYSDITSPNYIPMFQYTAQDLQSMSNSQLQQLLDTGQINGIYGMCSEGGRLLRGGHSLGGSLLAHCRWGTKPK
jgi:hypothetical protein